jgi:AcrR family transcriptional regulator
MASSARVTGTDLRRRRPKKGRPTADDATKLNTIILAAATERFLADGYAATSMDAIAAAAKVSKGTLYSRYPQKEALLRAVVEDRVTQWGEIASRRNWMLGNTLEQRLKHHTETVMVWGISEEVRAFDRLINGAPEPARALYELRYRRMVNLITGVVRELTVAEGRPARNPERVAVTLMSALAGWIRMETMVRTVSQREAVAFAHHTIDLLITGRSAW